MRKILVNDFCGLNIRAETLKNQFLFFSTASPVFHNSARKKRGLVNTIGSIFNLLFGIMDNDDRVAINKDINNHYKNDEKVKVYMEQSALLIQSQIDEYSRFKALNQITFQKIQLLVNHLLNKLDPDSEEQIVRISTAMNKIGESIEYLNEKFNFLLQVMTFNRINPNIVDPVRIFELLHQVESLLPKNRSLPFSHNDLAFYYTHLETTFEVFPNFIVLFYEIPIFFNEVYHV